MRRPEFIARQGRRPSGWLGEIVARVMAHDLRRTPQSCAVAEADLEQLVARR